MACQLEGPPVRVQARPTVESFAEMLARGSTCIAGPYAWGLLGVLAYRILSAITSFELTGLMRWRYFPLGRMLTQHRVHKVHTTPVPDTFFP